MVADALECPGHPQDVQRAADGARVFHHERDALALDRLVFLVHDAILARHPQSRLGIQARERIERSAHHLGDQFADVLQFAIAVGGPVERGEPRGGVTEFFRLVADALEVRDRLDDRHDQAQVRCRGPARCQDAAAIVVDRHLHRVDLVIQSSHLLAQTTVAIHDRLHAILQLLLHQPAHLQHGRAHPLEVGVVTAQDVVRKVRGFHAGRLQRGVFVQDSRTAGKFKEQALTPPVGHTLLS